MMSSGVAGGFPPHLGGDAWAEMMGVVRVVKGCWRFKGQGSVQLEVEATSTDIEVIVVM
jgi:hypothetical protein